jgi:hypothetical protein
MAAAGWASDVARLPAGDSDSSDLSRPLASVTFSPQVPSAHEQALAAAIESRHSYRAPMGMWPVPAGHVDLLVRAAHDHGALLVPLTDPADREVWTALALSVPPHPDGAGRGGSMVDLAHDEASVAMLLSTSSDDRLSRLRAGEALSAVLLEATRIGMVSRVESAVVDADATRQELERRLLHGTSSPQILVCVGWPGSAPAEGSAG